MGLSDVSTRGPGNPRSRIMSRSGPSEFAPTDCTVVNPAMSVNHALFAMASVASAGGSDRGAMRPVLSKCESRWTWVSIHPGSTVYPRRSMTFAPRVVSALNDVILPSTTAIRAFDSPPPRPSNARSVSRIAGAGTRGVGGAGTCATRARPRATSTTGETIRIFSFTVVALSRYAFDDFFAWSDSQWNL